MAEEEVMARVSSESEDDINSNEAMEKENQKNNDINSNEAMKKENHKNKRKKRWLKETETAEKRGVCYLSRVPPHMDPLKLRQILSHYGDIQRIYLTPEDPSAQLFRKKAGGFRGQLFSEGWVEFTEKRVAKKVANMLNGEPIGGKKRSSFFYDLWNIKYLSKFKWDDLTEETAYKNAVREQKLALELSAAKKELNSFNKRVDQSNTLNKIGERLKKKKKIDMVPKVVRPFPQKKPVNENGNKNAEMSKEFLSGVFGGS